jgi:hypothetical protein
MDWMMGGLDPLAFWAAMAITAFAGFVKGTVGFAMPLIMMGAFSSFLTPEMALAGLILPTLITNLAQAFADGLRAAIDSAWKFRRYLIGTMVFILVSAPFVRSADRGGLHIGVDKGNILAEVVGKHAAPVFAPAHHRRQGPPKWTAGPAGPHRRPPRIPGPRSRSSGPCGIRHCQRSRSSPSSAAVSSARVALIGIRLPVP